MSDIVEQRQYMWEQEHKTHVLFWGTGEQGNLYSLGENLYQINELLHLV